MRSEQELLAEINAELPPLDWHQGAKDYVDHFFDKFGREPIERLAFTKPLSDVTPEDPVGSITEIASYAHNFANTIELLRLNRGARVLDVACGGGWVSHWLSKIGYRTLGIDISSEFVDLARRRVELDPHLHLPPEEIAAMFAVHNLELDETPDHLKGVFDVAVLESCLHHFVNPIDALRHVREMLKDDGLVLILEGENRQGAIPQPYLDVMLETRTLERPYPRRLLVEVFEHAGFPHYEFMGVVNGFFPESAPLSRAISQRLADSTNGANNCVISASPDAIRRIIPSFGAVPDDPPAEIGPVGVEGAHAPPQKLSLLFKIRWKLRRIFGG